MMISLTGLMLSFNMKSMMKVSSMVQLVLTIADFRQVTKIVFLSLCNHFSLKNLVVYYHLLLFPQRIGVNSFAKKMEMLLIRRCIIYPMTFYYLFSSKWMLVIYTNAHPHAQPTK